MSNFPLCLTGKTNWPWKEESPQLPPLMPDGSPWPRVSIVTPSYNQGRFLEETIRSVLLQGYPNLEYIIMDGGSTDNSLEIIKKYEPWLATWVSAPDGGQAEAINRGVSMSQAEIVGWQNSDDTYLPGAIAAAVQHLADHPECDVTYGDCNLIDEESRSIGMMKSQDYSLEKCLLNHIVPNQTAFIRRKAWEAVGGINEKFHYVIEDDLWSRLGLSFHFQRLLGTLANHRKHLNSKTVSLGWRFYSEHISMLIEFYKRPSLPETVLEIKDQAFARAHLLGALRLNADAQVEKFQKALVHSLEFRPEWVASKIHELIDAAVGWAWMPDVLDPIGFLDRFFRFLPDEFSSIRKYWGPTIGEVAIGHFFKSFREGNRKQARYFLRKTLRYDWHRLLNRGVVSVGFKSFLP